MRIIYVVILTLLIACQIQAQSSDQPNLSQSLPFEKVKLSLNAGTSFFYSPNSFSGTSFYVAPKFSYNFTPKFRINAGVMLIRQNLNLSSPLLLGNDSQPQSVVIRNTPAVQGIVFAEGDYLLSERLTLSGSLMKSIEPNDQYKNAAWRNSFQMMSMDVNYKLSNTISVGAGVRMIQSNGFNNFFPSTITSPGIYQPFYRGF